MRRSYTVLLRGMFLSQVRLAGRCPVFSRRKKRVRTATVNSRDRVPTDRPTPRRPIGDAEGRKEVIALCLPARVRLPFPPNWHLGKTPITPRSPITNTLRLARFCLSGGKCGHSSTSTWIVLFSALLLTTALQPTTLLFSA